MDWLLKLLGIDPLGKAIDGLNTAYRTKVDAANDADRIRAEVEIDRNKTLVALAQKQNEIRLATAGFWEMRLLTFLIAAPFALHSGAVGLDTTFKLGWRIDAYPAPFAEWEGAILLSFFGIYAGTKAVTSIAAAIASRKH